MVYCIRKEVLIRSGNMCECFRYVQWVAYDNSAALLSGFESLDIIEKFRE